MKSKRIDFPLFCMYFFSLFAIGQIMIFTNHEDVAGFRYGIRIKSTKASPLCAGLLLLGEYIAQPIEIARMRERNRVAIKEGRAIDIWDSEEQRCKTLDRLKGFLEQIHNDTANVEDEAAFYLYTTTGSTLEPGDTTPSLYHWVPSSEEEFRTLFQL